MSRRGPTPGPPGGRLHRLAWLWTALVAGVAVAPHQASARPVAPRPRPKPTVPPKAGPAGEVRYLTNTLAYLNRGREDGLRVGAQLAFSRGGRQVGVCTVDVVSDRWSTCAAGALHKGDKFGVILKAEVAAPAPPFEPLSEQAVASRHDALMAVEAGLVEFDGDSGGPRAHRVAVALGQTTYANLSSSGGPFQVQRLDAAVYDVEIWKGLRASADVSVLNFSRRPDTTHSVYQSTPVLLVRQLEIGFRRPDIPVSGALGRVWTRWVPGLTVLDGAQAAYRVGDWLETGVYGGLLPNAYTLALHTSEWATGAFVMARFQSGEGAESTLFQTEARLGYSLREQLGGRFELGAAGHVYAGKQLDAHASLDLGYGGQYQAVGGLDALRIDVGWRPVEALRIFVGGRYQGGSSTGVIDYGATSPMWKAIHADGGGTYEATSWLWVSVVGGGSRDFTAGLAQGRIGPELTFPGLLGRGGAVTLGYSEEFGWLAGRSAYLQLNVNLFGRARILSRTSWLAQTAEGLAENDLAESLNLEVAIFRWLWARVSVSGRTQLEQAGSPSRTAGVISFQVGGQY